MKYSVIVSLTSLASIASAQLWGAPGGGGWGWGPGYAGPECAVRRGPPLAYLSRSRI